MFKKFFGGGDDKKKEQAPPPPPPPPPVSKDVEAEKIIVNLERQIGQLSDECNKLENKAEVLTQKAKEYMAANKKKEAKQTVSELTEIKKKIEVTHCSCSW
jgi:peptidoglycan hydrolase CwlO-like protein